MNRHTVDVFRIGLINYNMMDIRNNGCQLVMDNTMIHVAIVKSSIKLLRYKIFSSRQSTKTSLIDRIVVK